MSATVKGGRLANALVVLQAHYHHRGEAASEKCLGSCTTLVDTRELGGTAFERNG
jgi:hypothetical protein